VNGNTSPRRPHSSGNWRSCTATSLARSRGEQPKHAYIQDRRCRNGRVKSCGEETSPLTPRMPNPTPNSDTVESLPQRAGLRLTKAWRWQVVWNVLGPWKDCVEFHWGRELQYSRLHIKMNTSFSLFEFESALSLIGAVSIFWPICKVRPTTARDRVCVCVNLFKSNAARGPGDYPLLQGFPFSSTQLTIFKTSIEVPGGEKKRIHK